MVATTLTPWPDQRDRAARLAHTPGAIRLESDGTRAVVASFSTPGKHYTVARAGGTWTLCQCAFHLSTGIPCGHGAAASIFQLEGGTVKATPATADLNAPAAQEVHLFDALLTDLVASLPDAEQVMGRPRVPDSTLAWCAVKKAYTGFSARRNQGFIHDAQQEGYIHYAPRWSAVSDFLNREDTADLLRGLVRLSAAPLIGVEQDFAVDGTGFACGTYGSYKGTRYGGDQYREWVKLHACSGILTNIVTDAVALDGHSADSPQFEGLVRGTVEAGFTIREVSADKAYSSKKNHWTVHELGGEALIPFKGGKNSPANAARSNAKGLPGSGGLWRRAYHYFALHETEFNTRYHKRSNVEATFSAIKRVFGERLKSRTERARQNEVLCKVIAWNIRVVIQAVKKLGIEADFEASVRKVGPGGDFSD